MSNLQGNPSVDADIGQINPDHINARLLKDITEIIDPIISSALPQKRSGFSNAVFIIFQVCILLLTISPNKTANWMEHKCQEKNICFQRYQTLEFVNKKKRRFFPDQPSLSRYLKRLDNSGYMEEFWNLVLLAHALYLNGINMLGKNIKLIADYFFYVFYQNIFFCIS